jgi:hypothetical protein
LGRVALTGTIQVDNATILSGRCQMTRHATLRKLRDFSPFVIAG